MHSHIIGFPRLGAKRNIKWPLEKYWRGQIDEGQLHRSLSELRQQHWQLQKNAELSMITVGDFAYYDQTLELSELLGVVPARHRDAGDRLARCFAMARGGAGGRACQMKKWFNTNYHYLVPEFDADTSFAAPAADVGMPPDAALQVREAAELGLPVKATLIGPVSYLYLGKMGVAGGFAAEKLALVEKLADAYAALAARIGKADWLQLEEPVLSLDMPDAWLAAMSDIYRRIEKDATAKLLIANSYGSAGARLEKVADLPVAGVHVDVVYGRSDLASADRLFAGRVLSAGAIDGRNIWRANLGALQQHLAPLAERDGGLWIGSSCSMQHVPHSCASETDLIAAGVPVAFAVEKLAEIGALSRKLAGSSTAADEALFSSAPTNIPVANPEWIDSQMPAGDLNPSRRSLKPGMDGVMFPTTTIGSLPQTSEIRSARASWRKGELDDAGYEKCMREEIRNCISRQEEIGLDVLVHGECERNDMVEYFAHQLDGIAASENGWVISYGSRATRPPIIHGTIKRRQPMTVEWSKYAAGLTDRPMKGMLTGPVTIICWSFPRADVPKMRTAFEIADALHEEVRDLQEAGLAVIQVDEPALREGLPLLVEDQKAYLAQAVASFNRICADIEAQIHTHMCYSEFFDIVEGIAAMDADVISLETSRSKMEELADLKQARHAGGVGPGVYDVHSPRVPDVEEMVTLLKMALKNVPAERMWVNPDCGLKTRGWTETEKSLRNMVAAARQLRTSLS
ncbi:MAG: 5-methyltetrahydropteroyltriglutamate--homocysteine S-methyltransferase [Betaproteobacteria bacterium]|nr:5-methyltetrahydropteroyltriglutamate--homocysteine S-methyltransferase [Betaproteobacteria bacterium]